ncbi:MAG: YggS family pyridoxal phosphate-dependent enzyme [Bacillota bacterium]
MTPTPAEDAIARRHGHLVERVNSACRRAERNPDDVSLVTVSKGRSAPEVASAVRAGLKIFGENRAQEFREKYSLLEDLDLGIEWDFIGRLQPNKVRLVVGAVRLIHSVDSEDLVEALEERSREIEVSTRILLQVNVTGESTKAGVNPADAEVLLRRINGSDHLRPEGLMTMAPQSSDPEDARPAFAGLSALRDDLEATTGIALPELSMGMTDDFEVAVEEGATLIRIGRALFEAGTFGEDGG